MDFQQKTRNKQRYVLIIAGLLFSVVLFEQKNDTVFASETGSETSVIEDTQASSSSKIDTPSTIVGDNQESISNEEAVTTPEVPAESEEQVTPPLVEEITNPPVSVDSGENSQEEKDDSLEEKQKTTSEFTEEPVKRTEDSVQIIEPTPESSTKKEPIKYATTTDKAPQPLKASAKTPGVVTKAQTDTQRAAVQDVPIYRIYNPNSGEHFYTMNGNERDMLKGVGWRYEGIGWRSVLSGLEVYRLYNPNSGEHFYTMNGNERNMLNGAGWRYEGIGWHTLDSGMPVYRVYNPNGGVGAHHYTVNANERDNLRNHGWRYEGVGWYSTPFQPESVVQWASGFFGITRAQIVNELAKHENDRYYLYTPFRGLTSNASTSMSPNGDPNGSGPGMNCTGFIASVIKRAGGNLAAITNVANAWGGVANGYNWRDALTKNVQYETFTSVGSLLQSGLAKKGDILYFEPDYSKPNYDCHLGFFWGNMPNDDRIWHSTFPQNNMSNIKSMTPWTKIYLFRQG